MCTRCWPGATVGRTLLAAATATATGDGRHLCGDATMAALDGSIAGLMTAPERDLAALEDKLLLGRFEEVADAAAELARRCAASANGGDVAATLQRCLVVALQAHFYCGR